MVVVVFAAEVADVVDVGGVVEVAAAADVEEVEVEVEAEPPPHPAIAIAAKIVLSSAFFTYPTPVLARKLQRPGYKTPPALKRFGAGG